MRNKSTLWWIIGVTILIAGLFFWSTVLQGNDPDINLSKLILDTYRRNRDMVE